MRNYSLVFQSIGSKFSCELLPGFYEQCMENENLNYGFSSQAISLKFDVKVSYLPGIFTRF